MSEIQTYSFTPEFSTDEICVGEDITACLTDVINDLVDNKADADHTHSEYALTSHTHSGYATTAALTTLEDVVDTKANATHSHSEYALSSHSHSDYATQIALDTLAVEVDEKADATHNHDSVYSAVGHSHTDYATSAALNEVSTAVSGKADAAHSHNDIYYTETEVDTLLAGKANSSHTHTDVYDVSGSAASALSSANAYTDSKIDAIVGDGASTTLDTIGEIASAIEDNQDAIDLLNAAIANKANVIDLTSHASDAVIHITASERTAWNAKSDFSGNYNDLTNKPTIPSVEGLATETYVDTQINAIDIPSALSDLTDDATHRVVTDSEKATWNAKSDFSGSYNDLTNKPTIPSISGLATETYVDTAVSTKADSNHNHNSSYDALGTAEEKANAVQANLDVVSDDLVEHIDNADIHFTAAERTKLSGIATNANNYSHPNSGVTAGTYRSVTVNAQGHVTAGTNPTTLAGYGITDAESKGAASDALASAKDYTDDAIAEEVTARDAAIATAKSSAISTASSDATTKANNALASAKTYTDSAVAAVKDDLLGNAGSAYDTLRELGDLIDDNTDAIDALEVVASGKANATHAHAISDVTGLQTALDGKASTSHGTHVTYSSTAPTMNGTASVGSSSTVARSDHKHPVDTSRAAQTDLDALETVVAGKANSSHTHAISDITNLQTTLDGKSNTGHTHSYAGSSSVGGAATSANKLNTNAGSATQPVYFSNGVPVATTYTLGKSVPSNAVFTDTTYSVATTSANGLMSTTDKAKLDGMVLATVSEVETYLAI